MDIVAFSTRRRVTVAMSMFTLFLFGAISWFALKVNLLPDLSYPTLTIRTEYTGAAPSELETLVTEPVEEAVGVVKGLRHPDWPADAWEALRRLTLMMLDHTAASQKGPPLRMVLRA